MLSGPASAPSHSGDLELVSRSREARRACEFSMGEGIQVFYPISGLKTLIWLNFGRTVEKGLALKQHNIFRQKRGAKEEAEADSLKLPSNADEISRAWRRILLIILMQHSQAQ